MKQVILTERQVELLSEILRAERESLVDDLGRDISTAYHETTNEILADCELIISAVELARDVEEELI